MAIDGIPRLSAAASPPLAATATARPVPAQVALTPLASATALRPLGTAVTGSAARAEGATSWQPLAGGAGRGDERRQALAAVKEFEAVFLRQLAGVMTRSASGLTAGSEGAAFYQGMIEEQLGRLLAERGGGLGLQEALLARLEGQNHGDGDAAR
jgi:Rod binding domain-containing protein